MKLPGRNQFQRGTLMTMDSSGEVFVRCVSVSKSFSDVEGRFLGAWIGLKWFRTQKGGLCFEGENLVSRQCVFGLKILGSSWNTFPHL